MSISDSSFLMQRTLYRLDPELHRKFRNTALIMTGALDKTSALFPDFTDHSARHALMVIDFMDRMVGEENIGGLNADELYILLNAAYLHDFGMTMDEAAFDRFRHGIVPDDYFEVYPERKLRDAIREYHQEFSAVLIRRFMDFFEIPSEEYAYCIAQVVRGHRRTDISDRRAYDPEYRLPNGHRVCLPYLAALIRLADELDIAIDRNPIFTYEYRKDTMSYRQHFAVKHLTMEEDRFVMDIVTEEQDVLEACTEAAHKLDEVLHYCRRVVNEETPFAVRQKKLVIKLNSTGIAVKRKICVLDTDAGTDDAMALCLTGIMGASMPDYVVVSPGNTDIRHALRNVLLIRRLFHYDFTVVRGEEKEQVPTAKDSFHGADGFGNLSGAIAERIGFSEEELSDCISFRELRTILKNCEELCYTTIGPLGSLASLLEDPDISDRLHGIFIMGGGLKEFNCAGHTEYNFAKDPQSVKKVLHSGKQVTLFPLDLTNHQTLSEEQAEAFSGSPVFPEAAELVRFNLQSNARMNGIPAAVLHDTMPVLYQCFPEYFHTESVRLGISDCGGIYEDEKGVRARVVFSVRRELLYTELSRVLRISAAP